MSDKFLNKFRIESSRLKEWNYSKAAAYYLTICTRNREHYFGEIHDEKMSLSPIGKIVESEWKKTPEIRPDMNLKLDEFVVMPNHFHGILIIGQNAFNTAICTDAMHGNLLHSTDAMHGVSTNTPNNKFASQSKNLASIIRGFKSAVTSQVKKNGLEYAIGSISSQFAWHPRFYDHIIRDTESLNRIRQYIIDNPKKWKQRK